MSREFGEYRSGFFHEKIESAAEDCEGCVTELTQLWGRFLKTFSHIAYEISNYEASDSGLYAPIMESIKRLPQLYQHMAEISDYLGPYERLMEEAICEHENKKNCVCGETNSRNCPVHGGL